MADDKIQPHHAARALGRLGRAGMRRLDSTPEELPPLERFLREWQSKRLAHTHADLLASPEFGPAARFFLTDIYAPKDFSRRDADLLALYEFLNRILPAAALRVLKNTVELNDLTHTLEGEMVEHLHALGVTDRFTDEQYEEAYRQGDYDQRVRQIALIVEIGRDLGRISRLPFIGPTLHAAGVPARRLGWGQLQDFLERGYYAWRTMRRPDPFLHAIEARETAILNRIFRRSIST